MIAAVIEIIDHLSVKVASSYIADLIGIALKILNGQSSNN